MTSAERLGAVLARWGYSHGVQAEIPLTQVELRFPSSAEPEATTVLYENATSHLLDLLELELAARLGDRRAGTDTADVLLHAALRYRHLRRSRATPGLGVDHPRLESRIAATLGRLLEAAEEAVADAGVTWSASPVTDDLRMRERASLPPRATVPAIHDAATLADQFLLTCLPGSYTCAVHIRVFRPAGRPAVVIIGELIDYHSPGLIEEPERFMADLRRRIPELVRERPRWVHWLPTDYLTFTRRHLDEFDAEYEAIAAGIVREVVMDGDAVQQLRLIGTAELDAMVDGSVRRWHGADYHAAGLTAWGVRTVDSVGAGARVRSEPPRAWFRCGRRRCDVPFAVPLRRFADARCPTCGSTKLQPVRLVEN